MQTIQINSKPVYESTVKLSAKGQVVISAEARNNILPAGIRELEQQVFADGTIVFRPKIDKRAAFEAKVKAHYEKYGASVYDDAEDKTWLNHEPVGEEIFD